MTPEERITQLEARLAAAEGRIAQLEGKPVVTIGHNGAWPPEPLRPYLAGTPVAPWEHPL